MKRSENSPLEGFDPKKPLPRLHSTSRLLQTRRKKEADTKEHIYFTQTHGNKETREKSGSGYIHQTSTWITNAPAATSSENGAATV